MGSFTFNGERRSYVTVGKGLKLPAWSPVKRELKTVNGKAGAHLTRTDTEPRPISVPIRIIAESFSDLQLLKEDLADWLVTDEPKPLVIDAEPNRTYYAAIDGSLDLEEIVTRGKGVLEFICPDPYKYAPSKQLTITSPMVVKVEGNEPTPPYFRFNVMSDITSIDIVMEGTYMSIGQPEEPGVPVYEPRTKIVFDILDSLIGWGNTSILPVQGAVTGKMGVTGENFYAQDYGSGVSWHGPALQKTFNPLNDYMIRSYYDLNISSTKQRGLVEMYMLGADGSIIGRVSVSLTSSNMKVSLLVELWNGNQRRVIVNQKHYYRNRFYGYVEIQKRDSEYIVIVGLQELRNGRFYTTKMTTWKWTDVNNLFSQPLAGAVPYIAAYSNSPSAYRARFREIYIYRYNQPSEGTPVILQQGDIVEIDHETSSIIVNGASRTDLKDFGADYFNLKKGDNLLMIEPSEHLTGVVEWSDRFK